MARSAKPRKKYRPKPVIQNPIEYAISGMRPLGGAGTNIRIGYHLAMQNLTKGSGTLRDWQDIADALNVGIVLAERGLEKEYLPELKKATYAHLELRDRFKKTGRMIYRAEEMTAINEALEIHDAQMEASVVKDVELAVAEVNKRLKHRHFLTKPSEPSPPSPQ